ncbi:MAG: sialate O-acetylesterase, partial [Ginsengibacter sp.]
MSQINNGPSQTNTVDSSFDLYLLIGQSNMSGRGVVTEKFKEEGDPNVFMLTKENTWVPAKNPLHFDKPTIVGVGPGLSFGIAMEKA